METELREYLERNWGWIVLRGVAAVLFGVFAIASPGITLAALVILWGAYALVDGTLTIVAGWQIRDRGRRFWPLMVIGVLGIAAGVLTFRWPGLTALALLMVIASWAIAVGFFQIVAAIRLRKVMSGEWALGLSGVLSLAFGVLAAPLPGCRRARRAVADCRPGNRVRLPAHRGRVPPQVARSPQARVGLA